MTYQEQLQHPKWKKRKARVINDAGGQCLVCRSSKKKLHVHHICYIQGRMLWEYDDVSLFCLCEDCHKLQHPYGDSRNIPKHGPDWDEHSLEAHIEGFYTFQWN